MRYSSLLFIPLVLFASSRASLGQSSLLRGKVLIASTELGIESAHLTLDTAPSIVGVAPGAKLSHPVSVVTSANGEFAFPTVPPNTYVLTTRRIGYAPLETLIELKEGVSNATIALEAKVVVLSDVDVIADTRLQQSLARTGFLDRRRSEFGTFMDANEIARVSPPQDIVAFFRRYIHGCTMIYIDGAPRRLREITMPQIAGFEIYRRALMRLHNSPPRGFRLTAVVS
ncbi:MAG: carboxypeptidase-like regulatory domain-containing protein [Gemmatimonadota bacterium]|nr:carboxypeptidase-like regulatory domain-containing protein [Gemmatimonadota bacterium]